MRIAVTAKGQTLDDAVDPRFGRCPCFVIVDTDTLAATPVENPNVTLGSGAGIQTAQFMAEQGVRAVVTGNCGPNAFQTLNAAGIEVVVGASGTVREAVEQFKSGTLSATQGPNVASHFGTGLASNPTSQSNQAPPLQADPSMGSGMGGGMGRGMGGGRGMGRGMGMGGGRGMGRGGGRGMGRGMGMGGGGAFTVNDAPSQPSPATSDEMAALQGEAQGLAEQLQSVQARMAQLEEAGGASALVAVVNAEKCNGCGVCTSACPADAIRVEEKAVIEPETCTGCGVCVAECPEDAVTLAKRK